MNKSTINKLCGHTNINQTCNYYTHLLKDSKKQLYSLTAYNKDQEKLD